MPFMRDFECADCGNEFEDLVSSSEVQTTICPACGGPSKRLLSAVTLGFMNDPQRKKEALIKRSREHSVKEMKRNPAKLADIHGGTPRAQNPWNIRKKSSE